MQENKKYYKENIKDRMYKHAVAFWGVRNVQNLDTVVKYLIEALASEIYRLSNEVHTTEVRILEQIAGLLTPDILMAARPSHMILHAHPLEAQAKVNKTAGFFYDDPVFNLRNKLKISFYPVNTFSLIRGHVKSLIADRNIYTLDKYYTKEIFARSNVRTEKFSHTIWIGLKIDSTIKSVRNLSFYFDFINMDNRNGYLHLLPFTQWECLGDPVKIKEGVYIEKPETDNERNHLFSGYAPSNISDESIGKFYDYQFITIDDELKNNPGTYKKIPDELSELFTEESIDRLEEPLLWLKVSFPPNFNEEILENVTVAINAFPVANKNLRSQQSKTNKLTNTISLPTDENEFFLSVSSVVDSQNHPFDQLPFRHTDIYKYGTYTVKKGGMERFDSRDAKEYISNLMDLLREEGVAFSLVGKGFLNEFVQKVNELVTTMEHKLSEMSQNKEIQTYLILDSDEREETIYVDYWVTNCEIGNDIKAGALLTSYNQTLVDSDSVFSLTHSTGGRKTPRSNTVLDMYKYILTSRDRIYTNEDMVNFCYSEFGDVISLVDIKKGVQVSTKPKEGLIRTIDVFVTLKSGLGQETLEMEVKDKLLNLLKEKSPDSFNYRVFINK